MNKKTIYLMTRIALAAVFAVGLILMPAFNSAGTVSAQKRLDREVATSDMIFRALNLKSASGVTVVAENAVTDKGGSSIRGEVRSLRSETQGAQTTKFRKDLSDSFSAINQLPCVELADADLGGKTFGPGVYCMNSARLTGELVLDGNNDPGAIFVFRVRGSIGTEKGSMVSLVNNAQAASAFFVAEDAANVGENSMLKGNLYARNSIVVGSDATVEGKAISLKGDVTLNGSVLGPQAPGFLEICKAVDTTGGLGLEARIFRFQIGTLITEVPGGACSGPISIEAGPIQIVELQTGRNTAGSTFNGNFQLTNVRQLTNLGQPNTTALTSFNGPNFTANVNIVAGDISSQTRIEFTNRFAITAIVEICKEALDSGVTGFFNFTINGLVEGNTTVSGPGVSPSAALVPFTVPVGQCTGPIAVVAPSDINIGPPRTGTVTINESPRTGFIFTSATTANGTAGTTTNRLVSFNALANGGGNATVVVVAGSDGGATAAGGTTVQTTVFFNNRTAPAQIKVCKVAGPGVAELTPFSFTVSGTMPNAAVTAATTVAVSGSTQNPSQGTLAVGAVAQGGTVAAQDITVLAGPASNPGGFCQIVPGTFVVDTIATVTENGPGTMVIAGTNVQGAVRVSRITSSSGIVQVAPTGGAFVTLTRAAGVAFFPPTVGTGANATQARVTVLRGVNEVEFVNTAFSPVPLKICKIAGAPSLLGQSFTFNVTTDTAGGLVAPFNGAVTVTAGPAATTPLGQNGFCDFVGGPFANSTINGLGSFNFNTAVTVTEVATATSVVAAGGITSPTSGVITNTANRTATITSMINGVNEVQFVNTTATGATPPKSRKRIRVL